LTAFSARTVAIGLTQLPGRVDRLIVTGGGRKNATMMSMIAEYSKIGPLPTETFGWNGDAIEAQGFAYMAIRRLNGLPNTFPETTGVSRPMIGGSVILPNSRGERSAA
jgi:anhydro-N-acetylmuramic acid kinase